MPTIKISQLPIYPGTLSDSAVFPVVASNTTYQVSTANIASLVNSNITSVGTLTSLSVSGNTTTGNLLTSGTISAVGNIQGNYFVGNGSFLTGVAIGNADALANGTSNIHINVANGPMTFGISGTNNVVVMTSNNVFVTGNVSATGNVYGTYFVGSVAGNVATATTAGTVTTAAQPNITSVGTLTSLSVSGNLAAGNISVVGNIQGNYIIGNGSTLSSVNGANVINPVPLATAAGYASTVTSAAQGNITSVGTLTSLTVSGNTFVTGGMFKLPSYTTGQIAALTGMTGGEFVYNSTLQQIQGYQLNPSTGLLGWVSLTVAAYQ